MSVSVKSNREIELMREAGKILGTVLNELSKEIILCVHLKNISPMPEIITITIGTTENVLSVFS